MGLKRRSGLINQYLDAVLEKIMSREGVVASGIHCHIEIDFFFAPGDFLIQDIMVRPTGIVGVDLVVARSRRFIPFVFDVAGTHGAKAIFTDVQSDAAKIMTFVERIPRVRMEGIIANIRGMDTRWPNEIVRIKEGGFFLKDFFNARR